MRVQFSGSSNSSKMGAGCLTLFALPFAGVGVVTGYLAISMLIEGSSDWEQVIFLSIFGLTFGGVGFGLMFAAQWGKRKIAEDERLRGLHPDEPWLWKSEWASGRITGSSKGTMWFAWGFAIFWNLVSCPTAVFLPEEIEKGNHLAAIGFIFPVIGVGLLWWAVRSTIRYRKFGISILQMETLPGVIGGKLSGTVHTRLPEKPPEGVKVSLRCVRRRESRGKNSSSSESMIWEESRTLGSEHLYRGREGIDVPVEFHIPYDNQSSDDSDRYNKIIWRVGVSAGVSGVDFETQFEVPVFKTAESSEELPQVDRFGSASSDEPEFDPKTATVIVRPSALGGTEYYFSAGRNVGPVLAMLFFFLLFAGVTAALIHFDVGLIFEIGFGFFALLMLVFVIDVCFTSTRVVIEGGKVRVIRATFGIPRTKEIPNSDIKDVKLHIGMQQQQTMTQDAKAYYDLRIVRKNGKHVTAGSSLPDKREVEWLAEQMLLQIASS